MFPGRRSKLVRRRVFLGAAGLVFATVAAAILARRTIAEWAIRRTLAASGLSPAAFTVHSIGPDSIVLEGLSIGDTPWLTAGRVHAAVSLNDLAAGRVSRLEVRDAVWTVRIDDGRVAWGVTPREGAGATTTLDLPCDRVDIAGATIRLETPGQAPSTVQLTGTLTRTSRGGASEINAQLAAHSLQAGYGGAEVVLARTDITASVNAQEQASGDDDASGSRIAVAIRTATPLDFEWPASGIAGSVGAVRADARFAIDAGGFRVIDGALAAEHGVLQAGDVEVTDAALQLALRSAREVEVKSLTAVLGEGGTVTADPFVFDPTAPHPVARLTLDNISIADWLPLLSAGHATGEGRVSGRVEAGVDLTGEVPQLTHLAGDLHADPSHGFVQVIEADAIGDMLDRQDPRFATDPMMRPVRDRIVAALRDFAFQSLSLELSRKDGRTYAPAYISGRGRHGLDPQEINLTLDVQADDAWIDLFARLATQSRMRKAATDALEQFFGGDPPEDRP